jgi:hypothetical protein
MLVAERSESRIVFEAALTVGSALRRLAVRLRVPADALSLFGENGAALGVDELLRSVPQRLRVQTGDWSGIPVQIGSTRKAYFLPSGATAADLRSALWFDLGHSGVLSELTFLVEDRGLSLMAALSAAEISTARFVKAEEGRRLNSETAKLALRFPNGELLQASISVEAPLSLLRYGIAAECGLSFTEIGLKQGGVPLPEEAMQRTVSDLGLGPESELAIVGPLINFHIKGLELARPASCVSALDRLFDLRRRVAMGSRQSPIAFDFALDDASLDDKMVLGQGGFGAEAQLTVLARPAFSRVYLSDLDGKRLIVDIKKPTETRWGDLAMRLSKDPCTVGFEFHGRRLESFHAVADPRNWEADLDHLFLSHPSDPINIYTHELEIRISPESGDEQLRAIPVNAQTSVANLKSRLHPNYQGSQSLRFCSKARFCLRR